jgi:hypothetical protein
MPVNSILLAEKDLNYGRALSRAIADLHKDFEITLIDIDLLLKDVFSEENPIVRYDLVLAGGNTDDLEAVLLEIVRKYGTDWKRNIALLTEFPAEDLIKQAEKDEDSFWYIYKYVNVNQTLSDLSYLLSIVTGKKSLLKKSSALTVIGVYSAGGGTGRTAVALGISREMSRYRDKKVLYLNFEDIPDTELYFKNHPGVRTVGDYLYYLLDKKQEVICGRPESFTLKDEFGVETFCPVKGRNDLCVLSKEELVSFFKVVSDCSRYDFIVLDLKGDLAEQTLSLMSLCSRILIIRSDDPASEIKNKKFLNYINHVEDFQYDDLFISVWNKASSNTITCGERMEEWPANREMLRIEHDIDSFHNISGCLNIDITNVFGIGIKQITDEILSMEAIRQRGENLPDSTGNHIAGNRRG